MNKHGGQIRIPCFWIRNVKVATFNC